MSERSERIGWLSAEVPHGGAYGWAATDRAGAAMLASPDAAEGRRASAEKRPPRRPSAEKRPPRWVSP
jgi:hypothetical protein